MARSNSLRQHSPSQYRRGNAGSEHPMPLHEGDPNQGRPRDPYGGYGEYPPHGAYNSMTRDGHAGPPQRDPYGSMPRDPYGSMTRDPHGMPPRGDPYASLPRSNQEPHHDFRDGHGDPRDPYGTHPRNVDRSYSDGPPQPNGRYPGDPYQGQPVEQRDFRDYRDKQEYGRRGPPGQEPRGNGTLPHQQRGGPPSPHSPGAPRSPTGGHFPAYPGQMPNGGASPSSQQSTLQRNQHGPPSPRHGPQPGPGLHQHDRVSVAFKLTPSGQN